MANQAIYLVDFLMVGGNVISQVYCLATSPMLLLLRERSCDSGNMPRNFSELKSGGTIPMLSPHAEKWGDASLHPPSIDARG